MNTVQNVSLSPPQSAGVPMSHFSVTINGRQYRMACEEGQEPHLTRLANELDKRIAELRTRFGEIGDMRLTVMGALTVLDELLEAGKRIGQLEDKVTDLQKAGEAATDMATQTQAAFAAALDSAAARIEQVTKSLNQSLEEEIAIG
jgi:cell division protein ZapA